MKIQLHKSNRTMNPIIIRILISKLPNPSKIRLVEMFFEESETVLEYWGRVVFVEGEEECYDRFLFFWWEERDWTSFYIITSTLAPFSIEGEREVYTVWYNPIILPRTPKMSFIKWIPSIRR
jgi:hypothetical protein